MGINLNQTNSNQSMNQHYFFSCKKKNVNDRLVMRCMVFFHHTEQASFFLVDENCHFHLNMMTIAEKFHGKKL